MSEPAEVPVWEIHRLASLSAAKFPAAFKTFFLVESKSLEERKEAFETLYGFMNSHFRRRIPFLAEWTERQRRWVAFIALVAFIPEPPPQEEINAVMADILGTEDPELKGSRHGIRDDVGGGF